MFMAFDFRPIPPSFTPRTAAEAALRATLHEEAEAKHRVRPRRSWLVRLWLWWTE